MQNPCGREGPLSGRERASRGPERPHVRAAPGFGAALALAFGLAFVPTAGHHHRDPLAVFAAKPPQSAVSTANPAQPPAGVVARVAGRRITVFWDAVPGAGDHDYVVAVRAANGIVPFAWTEFGGVSSPSTVADMWAMSGLSYEVRVAVAGERPAWSPTVTVTAPVLQPAPAGAIAVRPRARWGQDVAVGLSLRGFTNRSPWRWSVCVADGSDCRLLPLRRPSWHYVIGAEAYGKRLRVQVDYDRDGVSRAASADLGIIDLPGLPLPPSVAQASRGCPRRPADGRRDGDGSAPDATTIETHLHALTVRSIGYDTRDDTGFRGGAVDALCDDLLVVTPWGRMMLVSMLPSARRARFLDGQVPMWSPELGVVRVPELAQRHPRTVPDNFRVADILLRPRTAGRWRLFVMHHYADAECIGFRLSSTTVRREGERVVVSPAWTTVLDFEPCVDFPEHGNQVGARMLPDGPNHLLAVVGDHGTGDAPQALDSNLGKLLRVDTGTGRAEVLAVGLRNPQGLARDVEGVLWATDHGPRGGDELNVLEAGGNYGWPLASHGVGYDLQVIGRRAGRHDGFAKPVYFWAPSIGISSVLVNDERFFPLWGNDLLVGSLAGRALLRIRRDGTNVKSVEEIYAELSIRDMAQMPDGRIALYDSTDGLVHFLSRSSAWCHGGEQFQTGHVYSLPCPPADSSVSPPR